MDRPDDPVGIGAQRQGEVEAVVVGFDVEVADVSRRGGQRAVEIAGRVVERVEVAVKPGPRVEQGDLVGETLLGVAGAHLAGEGLRAADRQVALHQLPDAGLQRPGLAVGEGVDAVDLAVEAVLAHRMADVQRPPGVEVAHGLLQQEPRRALIDADALERGDVHEADRDGGVYAVTELFDAVVHERGQEGARPGSQAFRDLEQRGSHRDLQLAAEVFADDFDRIGHE